MNARAGQPLRIGGKEYKRGVYCHAVSKVVVRLPGPGKTFTSVIGIDSHAGGGSIVFSVSVASKEAFRSNVMHVNDPGVAVNVDLNGATEFTLEVGDAGDGIACDQANWADAKVTLADGNELWLGDMALLDGARAPYTTEPPFSFNYDGKPFAELLKGWELKRSFKKLDEQRTERTLVYTDPKSGLVVRCAGIEYSDFPTVEWTLYLKNTGSAETPILSNILALDTRLQRNVQGEFVLHHHTGTLVNRTDYQPLTTELKPKEKTRLAPSHGRPCAGIFPYFNVEWPGEGVIAVVGWPGMWAAEFARDEATGLRIAAGQELTHFKLLPGEEVRSPLIVLQFWKGDYLRSQNIWRRWMIAHNLPRRGGKLPPPQMPAVSGNQFPGLLCNEADEILYINRYLEEGIRITHWWMDAGWYINKGDWTSTGTWEVDRKRFPRGLRGVADHAHSKGIKLIVWFEPERVTPDSWLTNNHPEWVLGGRAGGLLNLGNPDAWKWLVDRFDRIITDEGIDYYRQDFNMDPLPHWRANDAKDRQGITEIRHVEGYLAFWDELVRRHPDMMIDSCASGGHRNDLETLRRAVPLLRSDYIFDPIGEQCHTYGFAFWVPYWGTGFIDFDAYIFRGCMGLDTTLSCDARRKDINWDLLRKLTRQWQQAAPNFYGDYYPLTKYSLDNDAWMAWQFDRPDLGEGMVQAFRRGDSPYEAARFRLHALDAQAQYTVTDLDADKSQQVSGRELLKKGLPIAIPDGPGSAVVLYQKAR
jgi:alpha-galactosidase